MRRLLSGGPYCLSAGQWQDVMLAKLDWTRIVGIRADKPDAITTVDGRKIVVPTSKSYARHCAKWRKSALVHLTDPGCVGPKSKPLCDEWLAAAGIRASSCQHPASTTAPMAASVCWAAKPRARIRG
jgi:hypothetical protein